MRKSIKISFAAVAACLIAASGSAFTQANTVPSGIAGYGTNTVTGVTATNVAYNVDPDDASMLEEIVFTTTQDVSVAHTAILTINGAVETPISCIATAAPNLITCAISTPIAPITSIGLTVTHD